MQFRTNPSQIRALIPRMTQFAFVAGLLLGILLGWLFSGVVGAVMRFGFVAVALLLLMAAIFFWWNSRNRPQGEGPTVYTWSSTSLPPDQGDMFRGSGVPPRERRDQDVIDLDELKEQIKREREP